MIKHFRSLIVAESLSILTYVCDYEFAVLVNYIVIRSTAAVQVCCIASESQCDPTRPRPVSQRKLSNRIEVWLCKTSPQVV